MSRMHFRISTVGTASLTTTEKLHSWSSAQKPSRLRGGIRLLSLWTVVEEGTIVTSNLISRWLDPGYFDLLSTCAVFLVLWLNCEIQWPAFAISTRHENSLNLKDHWVIFHWLVNRCEKLYFSLETISGRLFCFSFLSQASGILSLRKAFWMNSQSYWTLPSVHATETASQMVI